MLNGGNNTSSENACDIAIPQRHYKLDMSFDHSAACVAKRVSIVGEFGQDRHRCATVDHIYHFITVLSCRVTAYGDDLSFHHNTSFTLRLYTSYPPANEPTPPVPIPQKP